VALLLLPAAINLFRAATLDPKRIRALRERVEADPSLTTRPVSLGGEPVDRRTLVLALLETGDVGAAESLVAGDDAPILHCETCRRRYPAAELRGNLTCPEGHALFP
jgi:hypothetical protein